MVWLAIIVRVAAPLCTIAELLNTSSDLFSTVVAGWWRLSQDVAMEFSMKTVTQSKFKNLYLQKYALFNFTKSIRLEYLAWWAEEFKAAIARDH